MMRRALFTSTIVLFALFALPPAVLRGGEFLSGPRLAGVPGTAAWAAFQYTQPEGPPEYEVRRFDKRDEAWLDLGRYHGTLAGLAAVGDDLWIATRDGALVKSGEEDRPAALPDQRLNILAIAWFNGGIVAASQDGDRIGLVRPVGDRNWSEAESVARSDGAVRRAVLLPLGDTLHLLWLVSNRDLSGGAFRHAVYADGGWNEGGSVPLGNVDCFDVFSSDGRLRLVARFADPLGKANRASLVSMIYEGNAWKHTSFPASEVTDLLSEAWDFAAVDLAKGTLWLTIGPRGAVAMGEPETGRISEFLLAAGPAEDYMWSAGVSIALTVLMLILFIRAGRKSRQLSLTAPGRPADVMSRAVAIFIDSAIVSIGVAAYHLAAGDLNVVEELLSAGMLNDAFWINIAALCLFTGVCEALFGQTPGKRLMGLRVRSVSGGPPGVVQALGRNLFRAADMFPLVFPGLIGGVVAMFNKRRQRIGDLLAGTVVRRHAPLAMRRIVLASASPRRRELLEAFGLEFSCQPAHIDEDAISGATPAETARMLAEAKARAVSALNAGRGEIIIAADTMVVVDDQVLGKPRDAEDAKRMLRLLAGRSHRVVSGVMVWDSLTRQGVSDVEETEVEFRPLAEGEIERYVASGDPMDKAGAYGIQSGYLVKQIRGSLSNVAGLPMEMLGDMFKLLDS